MDRNFGGVIWTNHVLKRLSDRGIKQGDAWATWRNPQQSRKGKDKGIWVYYKTYGDETIEVVAKQNEKKEWLILSVWKKPSFQYPKMKKESSGGSFFRRLLRSIINSG